MNDLIRQSDPIPADVQEFVDDYMKDWPDSLRISYDGTGDPDEDNPFLGALIGAGISAVLAAAVLGAIYLWCGR